jgi:hypothetical protein
MRLPGAIVVTLLLAATLAACGSGSRSSTSAAPSEIYVQRLDIHPRPPESAIPVAQHHLREALNLKKSPGSLEATIRRNELLTDILYQVGRCREHEAKCNDGRWERLGAKIARSIIFWGYALGTSGAYEASEPAVHRSTVERQFRRRKVKYGAHSAAARASGVRLLALELERVGPCKAIPTCPYEEIERAIAKLERETRPAAGG